MGQVYEGLCRRARLGVRGGRRRVADNRALPPPPLSWDIFCEVIDNHGDLGVCWRLSCALAARGQRVRLWVDDARALDAMAPGARGGRVPGVQVLPWSRPMAPDQLAPLAAADVWVEAFGCTIAPEFVAHFAEAGRARAGNDLNARRPPVWLNLEYLSAEPYVARMHALPSPVLHGPAAGWTKWFFYPGFTPATGGLLRECDLASRQAAFDRAAWRRAHGVRGDALAVSLFCYEPPALGQLLEQWSRGAQAVDLQVTAGRASAAVRTEISSQIGLQTAPDKRGQLSISYLDFMPQTAYDELLWACDFNFVRGEDSLVRALWAGRPFVWQIYPQHDRAHHAKLEAFLDWLDAPASLRQFHAVWNGLAGGPLPPLALVQWQACVQAARQRLLAQDDLVTQLVRFVQQKR